MQTQVPDALDPRQQEHVLSFYTFNSSETKQNKNIIKIRFAENAVR